MAHDLDARGDLQTHCMYQRNLQHQQKANATHFSLFEKLSTVTELKRNIIGQHLSQEL